MFQRNNDVSSQRLAVTGPTDGQIGMHSFLRVAFDILKMRNPKLIGKMALRNVLLELSGGFVFLDTRWTSLRWHRDLSPL